MIYGCYGQDTCPDDIEEYNGDVLAVTGIGNIEAFERLEDDTLKPIGESSAVVIESLELHISISLTAQNRTRRSVAWTPLEWFIKPANACSPAEGYIESEIVGMNLISNASLGPGYGAGMSLDAAFYAEEIIRQTIDYGYSDFLDSRRLDRYNNASPAIAGAHYILTLSPDSQDERPTPETTELHRFTYSIELATGEMFEIASDGVLISSGANNNGDGFR